MKPGRPPRCCTPHRPFAPVLSRPAPPGNLPMLEFGARCAWIMHVSRALSSFRLIFADFYRVLCLAQFSLRILCAASRRQMVQCDNIVLLISPALPGAAPAGRPAARHGETVAGGGRRLGQGGRRKRIRAALSFKPRVVGHQAAAQPEQGANHVGPCAARCRPGGRRGRRKTPGRPFVHPRASACAGDVCRRRGGAADRRAGAQAQPGAGGDADFRRPLLLWPGHPDPVPRLRPLVRHQAAGDDGRHLCRGRADGGDGQRAGRARGRGRFLARSSAPASSRSPSRR